MRVLLPPGCAEPRTLIEEIVRQAPRLRPLTLMGGLLLGDYPFCAPEHGETFRWVTFHVMPRLRDALGRGQVEFLPIRYFDTLGVFGPGGPWAADAVLVHTAPPDAAGRLSFGVSTSYPLPLARTAPLVIAEVNDRMPRTLGDSTLPLDRVAARIETDRALTPYPAPSVGEVERRIAACVSELIPDGATVQVGIGSIPEAVAAGLGDRCDLGVHSLLVDAMLPLLTRGVVTRSRVGEIMGTEPLFRFDGIWLNNAEAPLDDVKVRQALNYATDKESIIKNVLFGHAEVANHMMPKMRYWREDVQPYPYDLDKAKQLMSESSAADGFTLPLVTYAGDSIVAQVAQIVKESWAQIGVTVEIEALDIGTAYTNFSQFNYTAGANWYITSDVTAPDELAAIQFDYDAVGGTKSFFTQYKSARATELVKQAAEATDEEVRAKAFGDLQQLVMDDAPMVALYFTPARTGLRTNVHDFHTVKTAWWRLEDVSLA